MCVINYTTGDVYSFGAWFQCDSIPVSGSRHVKRISLKLYNAATLVNTRTVDMELDTDE